MKCERIDICFSLTNILSVLRIDFFNEGILAGM